jgi:NitT/TauT family transport system substrate-binding protein
MPAIQTRRRFLMTTAVAGAASALRAPRSLAGGALETTTVRIANVPGICIAPQYVAEELLRAEGFTDVRYVNLTPGSNSPEGIARGEVDFGINFASVLVAGLDSGVELTVLGGVHVGCFELFVDEGRSLTDLKGKKVGITFLGSPGHLFLAAIAAHIGIDPGKDLHWVASGASVGPMELFAKEKVDAFLGFPPDTQELRARRIGRVILNSASDRPWSQYFCCMLAGNREFARKFPVATKAVLRAILKAADLCASEPERAARRLVDAGFTPRYDYALQALNEVPYDKWREYDPEDTIRFYALRLREIGMIKSSPAEDHRRRHRLALSRRGQTRAEGVRRKGKGGFQCRLCKHDVVS